MPTGGGRPRPRASTPARLGPGFAARLFSPESEQDARNAWWLVVGCLAFLIPFLGRAFNVDDPLFLWVARQIHGAPANPFGFAVNWYGTEMPISEVTKNPPLAGYLLALAASGLGWSEPALHAAFLVPALAAILGTHAVARQLSARPRLAAFCTLFTPVFAVSSTTVMADTTVLAFWVWSVALWLRGTRTRSHATLALAGALIALAALTKYVGLLLVPLLAAHALVHDRRPALRWLWLLLPLAVVAGYQAVMQGLYGRGLVFDAASYATETGAAAGRWSPATLVIGLAFAGGCLPAALLLAGPLWSRAARAAGAIAAIALGFALAARASLGAWPFPHERGAVWLIAAQLALMSLGGFALLALAFRDLRRRGDADGWLLGLWVLGTFAFATFLNWTTNARSLLPMAPAAGILVARALERGDRAGVPPRPLAIALPLVAAAGLSLAVAAADAGWADSARRAARELSGQRGAGERPPWFQGHWGFQYYMEGLGARPLDVARSPLEVGDVLILPHNNTNVTRPLPPWARLERTAEYHAPRWLATMQPAVGAGFYADVWGPLPFAFGAVPPERYDVFVVDPRD